MLHNEYIKIIPGSSLCVLFIHGFLGGPGHFEEFIKAAPNNVSIYNILLDGHNKGVKEFGKASMKKWKSRVDGVLEKLTKNYQKIIIVAHSMGTFFAMEASVKYGDKIKGIFLMQSPLKIGLKPAAPINTVKSFFVKFSKDPFAKIYANSHSVKLSLKVWEYIPWTPRYLELFSESKKSRSTILKVTVPTYFFQSKKDELVSMKSVKYIPKKENINLTVLDNSAHFIYDKNDFEKMINTYKKLINDFTFGA